MLANRGIFADGNDNDTRGDLYMQSDSHRVDHPLQKCETRHKGHTVHSNTHTNTSCRTQEKNVPHKPKQGLKHDQRLSKLVETYLPLPRVTHVKLI